jgi:hypothetical protein
MDERYNRNVEIDNLLNAWEWCSRRLRVKWQRNPRIRNDCFIGLTCALLDEDSISGPTLIRSMDLPRHHEEFSKPLLNKKKLRIFWKVKPDALLELCLGCYTKTSPLIRPLNQLRSTFQNNLILDDLAKKMRSREKRFGSEWFVEGHHPESEFRVLKEEMRPLWKELKDLIFKNQSAIEELLLELLPQGWQFREIPASWLVRKTPEKLLNRATRLKLWQVAQDILDRKLGHREKLEALCHALYRKITPATRAVIEAQGYTVDNVVDDMLNFDMRKSRDEITA